MTLFGQLDYLIRRDSLQATKSLIYDYARDDMTVIARRLVSAAIIMSVPVTFNRARLFERAVDSSSSLAGSQRKGLLLASRSLPRRNPSGSSPKRIEQWRFTGLEGLMIVLGSCTQGHDQKKVQ